MLRLINNKKAWIAICVLVAGMAISCMSVASVFAQDASNPINQEYQRGVVAEVEEEETYDVDGLSQEQVYQKLKVLLTSGEEKGKHVTIEVGGEFVSNINRYETGDNVVVSVSEDADGESVYFIADYSRTGQLIFLALLFVGIVLLIGRLRGVLSLVGLVISLVVVFAFIIPGILDGRNPIFISVLAGLILIPVTFYISHGFKKTITIAIISSLISLLLTGVLGAYSITFSHITGMGIEDVFFLQTIGTEPIHLSNLIIAGIIISAIGVLDDVTVSQVSIVEQLYLAHGNATPQMLWKDAMKVGQDHISSMVNTLVLVYAGASIPVLLIFSTSQFPLHYMFNLEFVSLEIIRTLVTSIGLVVAIPLTTAIAAVSVTKDGLLGNQWS